MPYVNVSIEVLIVSDRLKYNWLRGSKNNIIKNETIRISLLMSE